MFKKFFSFIFEVLKVVLISLAIIIPVRYFLIQPFYVRGASMEPNFHDYEYLIIDEISYRFNEVERGEVIVFRYPKHPQEYFIKRVIAVPGETVKIKNGLVYVYNQENPRGFILDENYLPNNTKTHGLEGKEVELKEDEYFVLGDNRDSSKDSRSFGAVNKSFIIGKVWIRGWPLDKAEIFKYNINY